MSNIQVFNYINGNEVRVIEGQDGEPWFVAKDVADILEFRDAYNAARLLEDDEKGVRKVYTPSGEQNMTVISESGLYTLIMRSNKPEAKAFRKWVTGEVLPAIRKHGLYATPATAEKILGDPDFLIKALESLKEERAKNQALTAKIEEDKPKVIFAESVEASDGSILIGELAKILRQNGIDVGEIRLFKWMRENGFLCKARGEDWNLPTQRAMDSGLFKIKKTAVNDPNRGAIVRRTPKVTGKGQIYFVNGFRSGKFRI